MKKVLTIAGSDPCGGAGVQGDLKTFAAFGVYGLSVITSLTVQNTMGVKETSHLSAELVESQLDAILDDIAVDGVKLGMLPTPEIISKVARCLGRRGGFPLLIDSVIESSGGWPLTEPGSLEAMRRDMFPAAFLITPNLAEASAIAAIKVDSIAAMRRAAAEMRSMGPKNVLIKGGHLHGRPIDLLLHGEEFIEFDGERIEGEAVHGTGCALASAITALLAKGENLPEAVRLAKGYVADAIAHAVRPGAGRAVPDHFFGIMSGAESFKLFGELTGALGKLESANIGGLIAEVQSNLAYALPWAKSIQDVMAFPGRIVRVGNGVKALGPPEFGASSHVARIVLAAMRHDPDKRAAMNLKYSEEILAACRKLNLAVESFDRGGEPADIAAREGGSLDWGVQRAIAKCGFVPDAIYDRGAPGKEPMIRLIAKSPAVLSDQVLRIKEIVSKK